MGSAASTPHPTVGDSSSSSSNTASASGYTRPALMSSAVTTAPAAVSGDPLASHIARDLPRHIIERRFGSSSGRLIRSYRMRHLDSGALVVLKAMMVRIEIRPGGGASSGTHASNSSSSSASSTVPRLQCKGGSTYLGAMTQQELQSQEEQLLQIRITLTAITPMDDSGKDTAVAHTPTQQLEHPNVLPFYHWFASTYGHVVSNTSQRGILGANPSNPNSTGNGNQESWTIVEKPIYLLRPHVYSTLYDRMQSRPFLSSTEKMFIAFQILKALQALHQCTITVEEDGLTSQYPCCHGHLTCENVGLTSWNWVVLLDIAPPSNATKPICIPDDDPSDFIYYFQEQGFHSHSQSYTQTSNTSSFHFPSSDPSAVSSAIHTTSSPASGGGDKRCYLAPERFYTKAKYQEQKQDLPTRYTPSMDIFSLGCVLVELFLNGERAFDLGDLMEYRKKNGSIADHPSLQQKLNKIESSVMRAACRHMLQLDPSKRLTAGEYLDLLTRSSISRNILQTAATTTAVSPPFPPCFDHLLFPFLRRFRCDLFSPDGRIAMALSYYGKVIREILHIQDNEGETHMRKIMGTRTCQILESNVHLHSNQADDRPEPNLIPCPSLSLRFCDPFRDCQYGKNDILLAETDRLLRDIETTYFSPPMITNQTLNKSSTITDSMLRLPVKDAYGKENSAWSMDKFLFRKPTCTGALSIYIQFILSTFRHCQRPSSKVVALKIILRLVFYCNDEDRLQRIVPSLVDTLKDSDANVRATSITVLSHTISMVRTFPPSDARIFPLYIFKRVSTLVTDPVLLVRIAFTESIGILAETALRFLNTCHAVKVYEAVVEVDRSPYDALRLTTASVETSGIHKDIQNQSNTPNIIDQRQSFPNSRGIENTYDKEISVLRDTVARWVVQTATDSGDLSSVLKQALLNDISRLCDFFGQDGVMAYILPQVLAFLNDRKDWRLRASLCEHLPSICAVIGRAATEQFVVPCVETALIDEEYLVISSALNCLMALVEAGLVTRGILLGTRKSTRLSIKDSTVNEDSNHEKNLTLASHRTQGGIVKKYAPLLMHPCADVRQSIAALISAACRSMGFPDDEIILLPLFRPFLRHDISRFKLKIPDGILSCVMPPLSSVKDLQYVERELERMRILLTEVFGPKAERYYRECLIGIKTYLEMLPQSMNINCLVSNRILNDSLDVLPRSIFSCCIPDQRYAESVAEPPPQWYVSVRKMLLSRSRLALERCFLKSTSTLSKVYGMNINKLAISNSFQRRWKGDVSDDELNLLSVEDSAFSEAQLDAYLSSIDSMLCENITSTGEWGSSALVDPACVENTLLYISKVLALELPPLPPRIGMRIVDDERRPQTNDQCGGHNPVYWRPKSDSLVGTSIPGCDHVGPVMKLAVPNDSAYFVSGGSDGRISIWESRQLLDNDGCLKSQVFYSHVSDKSSSSVRINDMCIIDNSNAVVSAGSDGSVNVYRIDCLSGHSKATSVNGECPVLNSARVSGSSLVRKIACAEGEIVAVSNYITPSGAIITFASQRGTIHSWDLRSEYEPFALNLYPELGLICSMAVGKDMHSILTGTKKGFLALWDIRFHKLVKLWKNSNDAPVLSLNTFINDFNQEYRPYVAMSCGKNEVSLFDLITGSPRFCLRSLDTSFQYLHQSEIPGHDSLPPILNEIEIPSEVKRYSHSILDYAPRTSSHDMVTSIIGNYNGTGQSHFLTGGSDGWIRFWDLSSLSKCSIVSGPPGYTRSVYESMELNTGCHTIICRQTSSTEGSMLSRIQQRGPTRPEQGHSGAVLDLAKLESPFPVLLSCSGDGSIKAWK